MSPITQGIIIGVAIGIIMLVINTIILNNSKRKKTMDKYEKDIKENTTQIEQNKSEICETKELIKANIRLSMIIGDGLIELGVNGKVKKALDDFKKDIIDRV